MKIRLSALYIIGCLLLLMGCSKEKLAEGYGFKVVKLAVRGSTTKELEFIYKDSVIAKIPAGSIYNELLIGLETVENEIRIREKGDTIVLRRKIISPEPFTQSMNIFYDGDKVYDKAITLSFIGLAEATTLEFTFKGSVLASGTGAINNSGAQVPISDGQTQIVEIRKQGETTVLATKTITSSPEQQTVNFYYDGSKIVNNYPLPLPANPANMRVIAKHSTSLPAQFNGPADIIFYKYSTDVASAVIVSPEIRINVDAAFGAGFELPALTENYKYAYKLVKKGTTDMPYTVLSSDPTPLKAYTPVPCTFEAGGSQLWVIQDRKTVRASGSLKGTTFVISYVDVSKFINK